ncbi:MAG: ABC transporter permease, partial [Oscillospiraceae bacterium]|nr:ABC transporter permease [Oscillospiraceae bacterium]
QLLHRTALALMQGATPASNNKKSSISSSEKSLYFRLILRNMLSDRNRVLVTINTIAGGCVLMVVGFALRYGIMGVPDRQFGGIMTYDSEVYYDAKENEDAAAELDRILDQNNLQHIAVRRESGVFQAGDTLSSLTMIVAEKGTLEGYFALKDIHSGKALDVPESGALVPRRFHEYYGIGVGGTVPVYDTEMNLCRLPVAGVFENYYGQLFFLSPESYEESFGTVPEPNCFYVKTGGMPLAELQKTLEGVQGLTRVADAAAERVMIGQFTSSLNFVVYLMLFIAGVMACFIVANFTMTYIQRKTGELTIMRINGFTSSECIRYLALDLVVTTVLGTAVGLVLGGLMGSRILRVTETPYIQMIREPRFESFLFAALITFAFSALTNGFALRRIRKLKLTDINF